MFFHYNLVLEFGHIFRLWQSTANFEESFPQNTKKLWQASFSERWLSLQPGTFGHIGMRLFFQNIFPSFRSWRRSFLREATLHVHRIKENHFDSFSKWVDNLMYLGSFLCFIYFCECRKRGSHESCQSWDHRTKSHQETKPSWATKTRHAPPHAPATTPRSRMTRQKRYR